MATESTESTAPPAPVSDGPATAQLILGTEKHNPVFTVYRDAARHQLQVYYGFELLETLPDVPASPARKLMLARLSNAGVKITTLAAVFTTDPKTIRRWSQALCSGDPVLLIRVLEGRGHRRKCTPEVAAFVRLRLPELWAERPYGAIQRLRREIKSVFRLTISAKGLSSLIRELKAAVRPTVDSTPVTPTTAPATPAATPTAAPTATGTADVAHGPGGDPPVGPGPTEPPPVPAATQVGKREIASQCGAAAADGLDADAINHPPPIPTAGGGSRTSAPDHNAKPSPVFPELPTTGQVWCEHAGLLLFAAPLRQLNAAVPTAQPLLAQWLSCLLLGAQNIEQTKFLNWEDLALLLGSVNRVPLTQRTQLQALGTTATLAALFQFHAADLRTYHFEYRDQLWATDPRLRQIVVQATNPHGRVVQEEAEQRQRQRAQRRTELSPAAGPGPTVAAPPAAAAVVRELEKLARDDRRHEQASQTRRAQIHQFSQRLSELGAELATVAASESRLEAMIAAQMVRLEPASKRLLDCLRILARNLCYQALAPFKKAYNNFRDDHDYFRQLTPAAGVLEFGPTEVVVHLFPTSSYPPALKRIVIGVLAELNQRELRFPHGSERRLRFRLGARAELRLHLEVAPAPVETGGVEG